MGTSLQQLEKSGRLGQVFDVCFLVREIKKITSYKVKFAPVKGQLRGLRLGRLVPFES